MVDLDATLEVVKAGLPSVPASALRLFGEWAAPFERRFDYVFRPIACAANDGVLVLNLGSAGQLMIQEPAAISISPALFSIRRASLVRLNGVIMPGGPGIPPRSYVLEYRFDGVSVTRRDGVSLRSFPLNHEVSAVEFVAG